MSCGALRRCPAIHRLFDGRYPSLLSAPLLALYNGRRDAGGQHLPSLQLALAHGAASIGAPNATTLGIVADAPLRLSLRRSFKCWAALSYQPKPLVEAAVAAVAPRAARCVHARTMWVDDQRCFPNPQGCQLVDAQQLAYYNTSSSVSHSCCERSNGWNAITPKLRGAHLAPSSHSLTLGRASPLWWQLTMARERTLCRLALRPGRRAPARRGQRARRPMPLRNLSVLLLDASSSVVWRSPPLAAAGDADVHVPLPPAGVRATTLRIERGFTPDEAREWGGASMSFERVLVYADEPPSWHAADAVSTSWQRTCALARWRGGCGRGRPPPVALAGGWRRLMGCLHSLANASAAPLYLSTDSPALQELTLSSFPRSFTTLPGGARPSWEEGLASEDYLKAIADFEVLRRCTAIISVASSSYANMAASFSFALARQYDPSSFCRLGRGKPLRAEGPRWVRKLESCVSRTG
ncbi:hypothetical protein AB1Y20_020357 [Prymnesium parvum]|uniref:Peptide-O-fucosyltransferase 1 n=1 Tax=Prymnesium parvum TaxID=97485 RepID=A0AB34JUF7_PRYPA